MMALDSKADRLIWRTAMVGTVIAAYFLLTADYGPVENALDSIEHVDLILIFEPMLHHRVKRAIKLAEFSTKKFIFGSTEEDQQNDKKAEDYGNAK